MARPKRFCSIEGCGLPCRGHGWCTKHYTRWLNHGDPLYVARRRITDPMERFWSKVNKDGPLPIGRPELGRCWLWLDRLNNTGYGWFTWPYMRAPQPAHRVAHFLVFGFVPLKPLELDHLCRNRACVNPHHLETVTHLENVRRGEAGIHGRMKTHCPQGHPLVPGNLTKTKRNMRNCLICARESKRRSEQRLREARRAAS